MSVANLERKNQGMFEAFVNSRAYRTTEPDKALIATVTTIVRQQVPGSQVRWAGSATRGTAVIGSDLDMLVETNAPVTEAARRSLRTALEAALNRTARIQSHVIRLPATNIDPKVDISFANAAFGGRPLPDASAFTNSPSRQGAVRALKIWARSRPLPPFPGWAIEALVVHLDTPPRELHALELFERVLVWLDEKATPEAMESFLRPAAQPRWNPQWSELLPGRLNAISNAARSLRKRRPKDTAWRAPAEVERWLCQ